MFSLFTCNLQDVIASQEESPWLPHSSILIKSAGTECPTNVRVTRATTTSLSLAWTPPLVHGSNKLTGQIVRWSDVKKSRRPDHEDLQIASHVNLLPTEDSLTIDDLVPGAQYKVRDKVNCNIVINDIRNHIETTHLVDN